MQKRRINSLPYFFRSLWQDLNRAMIPLFERRVVRRSIFLAVALIGLYTLLVSASTYFIYQRGTDNNWTRFMERIFPYPAAVVSGEVIPLDRYRLELAARQHASRVHSLQTDDKELRKFVLDRLVNTVLYERALDENSIVLHEADVDNKLEQIYAEVGGKEKLEKFLRENYGEQATLDQYRVWTRETLIESAVQHQLLTHAKVRHILISLPENTNDQQVAEAKKKAELVKAKITDINQFGAVAKEYSEDVGSRDKGGELGTTIKGSDAPVFSEDFENVAFSIPIGQVSDPVRSKYGWHLLIVDEREGKISKSLKEYTEDLRREIPYKIYLKI